MALQDVVRSVERSERTLTVFNPSDEWGTDVVGELSLALAERNVSVEGESTVSGRPEDFVVIDVDGVVLATADVADLESLLETGSASDSALESTGYDEVLSQLQEATFASYDRPQMLEVTREIEDRAFRVGAGHLRAGFQTLDRFADQRDRYVELARRGLDVTAYATPGGEVPDVPDVTLLTSDTEEIASHWFVVFDGDGEHGQQCALVAEERTDGYYGIWTYDPDVVDWACTHLVDNYEQET